MSRSTQPSCPPIIPLESMRTTWAWASSLAQTTKATCLCRQNCFDGFEQSRRHKNPGLRLLLLRCRCRVPRPSSNGDLRHRPPQVVTTRTRRTFHRSLLKGQVMAVINPREAHPQPQRWMNGGHRGPVAQLPKSSIKAMPSQARLSTMAVGMSYLALPSMGV